MAMTGRYLVVYRPNNRKAWTCCFIGARRADFVAVYDNEANALAKLDDMRQNALRQRFDCKYKIIQTDLSNEQIVGRYFR